MFCTVRGNCTGWPGDAVSDGRRRESSRFGTCLTVRVSPVVSCAVDDEDGSTGVLLTIGGGVVVVVVVVRLGVVGGRLLDELLLVGVLTSGELLLLLTLRLLAKVDGVLVRAGGT